MVSETTLNGGVGVDTIITGTGFDTILFNAPLGLANFDRVLDFAPAFDTMLLENAVFTGLTQVPSCRLATS